MMKISIICPCYNEEPTAKNTVLDLIEKTKSINKEIIVVDDGSSDNSYNTLKNISNIILLKHPINKGKGAAFKTGVKYSKGEIIIPFDLDGEYDAMDIIKCCQPILDGKAEVVYGSRRLEKSNKQYSGLSYYIGGTGLTIITNLLYGSNISDEPNCLKVCKKKLFEELKIECDRFDWEPELTAKILKKGIKIFDVPVKYFPRDKEAGKKIKWKDGVSAVLTLLKWRFKRL